MATAHFVKKARKANRAAGVKKGESYWWASFKTGRSSYKRYWKKAPRPSQLTQSEFLSNIYAAQESLEDAVQDLRDGKVTFEDLAGTIDEAVTAVHEQGDECEGKKDNMPESLQEGPTGELLQNRADECDSTAQELETIADTLREVQEETEYEIPDGETDEAREARLEKFEDKIG